MPGLFVALPMSLVLPAAGLCCAGFAEWKIRKAAGELGGRRLAMIGFASHASVMIAMLGWNAYLQRSIAPPGYREISFSMLQRNPAEVDPLVGQNVIFGGYMHPTPQDTGLRQFYLVDHHTGGFGADYKANQHMLVNLTSDHTTEYRSGWLLVRGRLEEFPGEADCLFNECPKYRIIADQIQLAPLPAELLAR